MQKLLSLPVFIFCLSFLNSQAQFQIFLDDLDRPTGLAVSGNDLYYADYIDDNIYKIDLTQSEPIPEIILPGSSGVEAVQDMVLDGSYLYMTEFFNDRITRIDVTQVTPIVETVVEGFNTPFGIAIKDDELYYSLYENHMVYKINLTDPIPNPIPVITSSNISNPRGLEIIGDELYVVEFSGTLKSVDITQQLPATPTVVLTGLPCCLNDLVSKNGDLFMTVYNSGRLLKVLTSTGNSDPPVEDVAFFPNLRSLAFTDDENILYLSSWTGAGGNGKIYSAAIDVCNIPMTTIENLSDCNDGGTPSDASDDTFTADVTVTFENAPSTGTLNLQGDGSASISVDGLASPHTFFEVEMPADGGMINLTVVFSDNLDCFSEENLGTAPECEILDIIDNEVYKNIFFYPNPVQSTLNIQSEMTFDNIQIYSLQGKLMTKTTNNKIDVSLLSSGLYFVKLSDNGRSITKKFIKS